MAESIESDNVVGYQNREIGSFNLTLGTFVNADGSASTLGDIKPNAAFINAAGTVQTFTSAGKAGPLYIYVNDAEVLEIFEAEEGWYLFTDDELTSNKNSESLPFATGFVSKSSGAGSQLIYAGEVKGTKTDIPIGSFTLTGNCSPKDLTLGNLKPNAAFINAAGTVQTFTSAGKAGPLYIYVNDAEVLEIFEAEEGWYLFTDDELTSNKNGVSINAGDAFVSKSSGAGSVIEVPTAK